MENIESIFGILHDGIITEWSGDEELLILKVECEYIAKRIDKTFNSFYVEISKIEFLEFDPWMNPMQLPKTEMKEFSKVFEAELEIGYSKIENDKVIVSCNQHDIDFDFCGGNLIIKAENGKIFDQNRTEISIEMLSEICNDYWNRI